MDEQFSFGYWLRRQRLARDLRQAELARQLGIAPITLRKGAGAWELVIQKTGRSLCARTGPATARLC